MAHRSTRTTEHHRLISYSEISTALDCEAQWDFSYGRQLAGSSLSQKAEPVLLQAGRAWGAAAAALHTNFDKVDAGAKAVAALGDALEDDAERQREAGLYDAEVHEALLERLMKVLAFYTATCPEVLMDPVTERELLVPIPSRTGKRASRRYRLLCYLDATSQDNGAVWIEEFKLRTQLTAVDLIQRARQIRLYAWAYRELTGTEVAGVWTNEMLNEPPKPVRMVKESSKKDAPLVPSHAKDQWTTAEAYLAACNEYEVEPHPETLDALRARRWHQRVPIVFSQGELDEAGRELVAAGHKIAELDSEKFLPLRNAKRMTCNFCDFKEICTDPTSEVVDVLFDRKMPKRERSIDELLHTVRS